MGSSEELKPSKPEKPSSPAKDQRTLHAYPDWAMMQAYYGPQFAVPPYLNSCVASPHTPPPYMWVPPQYMIPQYGASYPVFYAHEGVYGHPGVFMGHAVSIGNGKAGSGSGEHGTDHRLSESEETGDSSDGSNGITAQTGQSGVKRSRAGSPKSAKDDKDLKKCRGYESTIETASPVNTPAKKMEDTSSALESKDHSVLNVKPIATYDPQSPIATEAWLQNEQELKQEKRKLSNRESARRLRLRKQAEAGELATKVQKLTIENITMKSEIDNFMEVYKKLELENATLMEKLEMLDRDK